ncbi:hypothetical protein [Cellulomonas pakistanensis]|uniref:Uncharacterized protein n=1 Tax=Cellulomonas pakistanensis TaxID=992287 RepID=A0A919U2W0_9CELL|nr:hypothetical protein [Cellulomonas pakistanensis]GIG36503.1 hypothetical protein Cpa01nite_18840 [Cellulomonas pakistanensis]
MKRDLSFWLMVAASTFGLVAVVIVVVAGDGEPSLPAALGAAVVLVVGWTAVAVRARQGGRDDRGVAGPTVPGPPARLVLSRGDDSAGMLRRIRVTVDGEPVALLKPRTVAEVDVPPGRHRVRASMDWTTSRAMDLDLVPGERVEIRTRLPFSMIWRMVTAPGDTLTIERVGFRR